jgi:hypothetical protein
LFFLRFSAFYHHFCVHENNDASLSVSQIFAENIFITNDLETIVTFTPEHAMVYDLTEQLLLDDEKEDVVDTRMHMTRSRDGSSGDTL